MRFVIVVAWWGCHTVCLISTVTLIVQPDRINLGEVHGHEDLSQPVRCTSDTERNTSTTQETLRIPEICHISKYLVEVVPNNTAIDEVAAQLLKL